MKIDSPTFLTETTFISSSVVFSSGSQKFGDSSDDIQQFTGSISVTETGSFGQLNAGSTIFGDTPADDTHKFTGSLSISGSSITGYAGSPPTAILSNPATGSVYGLHIRGYNRGIRIDRLNSTNASAHTTYILMLVIGL